MKFLTVFFIIFYLFQIFNQNKRLKRYMAKYFNKDESEMIAYFESEDKTKVFLEIVYLISTIFLMFIPMIVEMFYIAFAFEIAFSVTFVYLIIWLTVFIVGRFKNKQRKGLIDFNKYNKYSIKQMIVNIIDLSYFGFMFYMLFIK